MRIIQALCAIEYNGRCHTFLDYSDRIVLMKSDGCVLVMNDKGIKPLNYMMNVKNVQSLVDYDGNEMLVIEGRKETLRISFKEKKKDIYLAFNDDKDMDKTGTEDELQAFMLDNLSTYINGAMPICREFETGKGRVDVCGLSSDGKLILVEMKRKAVRKDVYQVLRYADGIEVMKSEAIKDGIQFIEIKGAQKSTDKTGTMLPVSSLEHVELYLAASAFTKNTIEEAREHNVKIIDVSSARRAIEDSKALTINTLVHNE